MKNFAFVYRNPAVGEPPLVHAPRRQAEREVAPRSPSGGRDGEAAALNRLVKGAYLSVHGSGRLLQVHLPGIQPPPTRRGICDGISDASRRRLLIKLHSLRRDAPLPVLLGLTFPEEVSISPQEAKACLRAMSKRIAREHKDYACVWRLEAHPAMSARLGRVCPHFHLLCWGVWFDLDWLNRTWSSVVWSVLSIDPFLSDPSGELVRAKHERAGASADIVRKWAGVVYCAKNYIAKQEEYPLGKAGRVWGWWCQEQLPLSDVETIQLTVGQIGRVRRAIEGWMASRNITSEHLMGTFYVESPSQLALSFLGP